MLGKGELHRGFCGEDASNKEQSEIKKKKKEQREILGSENVIDLLPRTVMKLSGEP